MTEIVKLINSIDTLFNVFVPGAICVWFYMKLSLKKIEYQGYLILSIAVGFVLKYTVDYLDRILPFVVVGFPIVLAYVLLGLLAAAAFYKVKNSVWARKIMVNILGVEPSDNIWTRHFDSHGNLMMLNMDDGSHILGKLETADDEYITLTYHCSAKSKSGKDMDDAAKNANTGSVLCIPMSRVKSFEFLYCDRNSAMAKYVFR